AFWLGRGKRTVVRMSAHAKAASPAELRQLAGPDAQHATGPSLGDQVPGGDGDAERDADSAGRMEGASRAERLAETDFRKIADPRAVAEAHALAARLAKRMRTRLSRRERARNKGRRVDLRRTIRRNISHGGVPIELVWRKRKRRPL